jgi:hypothetical protein
MRRLLLSLACLVALSPVVPALAEVVTSLPGGTVYNIPDHMHFSNGPYPVAKGVTWSSTDPMQSLASLVAGAWGRMDTGPATPWSETTATQSA